MLILIFFLRTLIWLYVIIYFSGNELSDADYYHEIAQEYNSYTVNGWAKLLQELNNIGLYNRNLLTFFIYIFSSFTIPYIINKNIIKISNEKKINYKYAFILIWLWPTYFIFSTDIFRDFLIIFLTVISILVSIKILEKEKLFLVWVISYLLIALTGYWIRPYLGVAIFISIFIPFLLSKFKLIHSFILYLILLVLFDYINLFKPLHDYRGVDGWAGGSSFGITYAGSNGVDFLYLFAKNFLYQIFGLYFPNLFSIIIFIVESLPIIGMVIYIIKYGRVINRKFLIYIISFSTIYATAFLIGSDNLGTAIRLRMPIYVSVITLFLSIYFKNNSTRKHIE